MASLGKLNVRFVGVTEEGNPLFEVLPESKYNARFAIDQMKDWISKGKDIFTLTIDRYIPQRSKEQNKLMWKLLEIMADTLNGRRSGEINSWDCYLDMLEFTGAKYEYLMCLPKALDLFIDKFRATKVVEKKDYNGKEMLVLKCFYGSSKLNVTEMTTLIDDIFNRLSELGVEDTYQADVEYMQMEWMKNK